MAETTNLATALAKVQGELPKIPRNKNANYGTYADLDSIHEAVFPILSSHGLAWTTLIGTDEAGNDVLNYRLIHVSGDTLEGSLRLRLTQDNMQQLGSAVTYARRYAICAVIGITADEDDDGNTASGRSADGKGETKSAPKRYPARKPDVFPEEPAIDIHEDVPVTKETLTKLFGGMKLKGFTDKAKVDGILNNLAASQYSTPLTELSEAQGSELMSILVKTDKGALEMLSKEVA